MSTADLAGDQRGMAARVGVTALNLVAPGLGLLRVGDWRTALALLVAPFAFAALFTIGLGHFPIVGYRTALLALALAVGGGVAVYIVPAVLTWRASRLRRRSPVWGRWYGLTAVAVVVLLLWQPVPSIMRRFYKGYYLPSESMAPTLEKDEKITAGMRWRGPLRRGALLLFRGPDNVRISRIAALPGDRIALRRGVPIVNGVAAVQARFGMATYRGLRGVTRAKQWAERFPGEATPHRILDQGTSPFENVDERLVPAGHVYVLGDNRDWSLDSRVPADLFGVGMVPLAAIIGRPLRVTWSQDHRRIGIRFDR